MKTAIIKTSFWKEDRIFELTPDVRHFYLCLLTNPERNTTKAFKCSDRMLCAFTGYNSDTISLCRKSLIEKEMISYLDGYYILNDQDYVEPTKGKLSASLQQKYLSELPENIRTLLLSHSGVSHEYIDKDNNKDKSIDIGAKVNSDYLFCIFWENYPPTRKQDRQKCLKKWNSLTKENQQLASDILDDVVRRKNLHVDWVKNNGMYVPAPLVYLNNARWEAPIIEGVEKGPAIILA